jgi:hypothetical protein
MPQKVFPVEERYGRLRPLDYVWGKGWRCVCDCGRETVVSGSNLRAGNVVSCGCYRVEATRKTGVEMSARLKASGEPFGWDLYRLNRKNGIEVRPMLTKRKRSSRTKPCWCCRRPTPNMLCFKCSGGDRGKKVVCKRTG